MPKKSANVSLKSFDDIFSTEESRQEDRLEHIRQIPISALQLRPLRKIRELRNHGLQYARRIYAGLGCRCFTAG